MARSRVVVYLYMPRRVCGYPSLKCRWKYGTLACACGCHQSAHAYSQPQCLTLSASITYKLILQPFVESACATELVAEENTKSYQVTACVVHIHVDAQLLALPVAATPTDLRGRTHSHRLAAYKTNILCLHASCTKRCPWSGIASPK